MKNPVLSSEGGRSVRSGARQRNLKLRKQLRLLPGYFIILTWVALTLWLLIWVLTASFASTKEIFSGKSMLFPSGLHFENYVKAWKTQNVSNFFTNSLIYSLLSCSLLLLIGAPCAYALSRFRFFGNRLVQNSFASAMGVPVIMVVLPLFVLISRSGLLNYEIGNRGVLIFLYVGMNIPYTVIFLMTFFANLSRSFEEAAAIDGCPPAKTFRLIMLPMAQPGLITVTIFNFINIWNEYFLSLIFANNDRMRPVAVGLFSMITSMRYTGDYAGMFAAVVIVFLPTFVLYLFLSERIIRGVTAGGVKG